MRKVRSSAVHNFSCRAFAGKFRCAVSIACGNLTFPHQLRICNSFFFCVCVCLSTMRRITFIILCCYSLSLSFPFFIALNFYHSHKLYQFVIAGGIYVTLKEYFFSSFFAKNFFFRYLRIRFVDGCVSLRPVLLLFLLVFCFLLFNSNFSEPS